MTRRIQLRRDTAANWTSVDPILAAGEVGVDLDTLKIKVGNGTSSWTELNYMAGEGSVDLAGYATEEYVDNAVGSIATSNLTNDLGFITATELNELRYATEEYVDSKVGEIDLSPYALDSSLPTDISQLSDNENRIPTVPTLISELTNDSGFITISDIPPSNGTAVSLVEGKTIYVTTLGDDTDDGDSLDKPLKTIKAALQKAAAGDIVKVSSGQFIEEFPLTVPKGVTVRGASLRATEIRPTETTKDLDCFLLEGESTIEELSIKGMFYNQANNTGYAFRFKSNAEVATRSPYIQRVTVLNRGSTTSSADPYGFLAADAGRGAYLDGADVTRSSIEAAMLFNECTFIVPNSRALIMTNGARTEWLNCFSYFADLAIEGVSGTAGRGGAGRTYLTLSGVDGTFSVGDTVSYLDIAGTPVEQALIIDKIDDTLVLEGKKSGFIIETADRKDKTLSIVKHGFIETDASNFKFGGGSLNTESGGFLSLFNDDEVILSTVDYTIEFWIYRTFLFTTQTYFDFRSSSNTSAAHLFSQGTDLTYSINDITAITAPGVLSQTNQWVHVAVSRSEGTTRLFVDGTLVGQIQDSFNYQSSTMYIAADFGGGNSGSLTHLDEFRISKGVSRYNDSFTVPDAAFINDGNTILLLHFDTEDIIDDAVLTQTITSSSGGTASSIERVNLLEFGAELRSIAGANVYGNQGVKADGVGVKLHFMSHNFAYIGTGADLTNDSSKVVQANEVIEVNNGEVFYSSIDQDGNYRIGDLFKVNYATGNVTFSSSDFNITGITQLTLDDGVNLSKLSSTGIETGNLVLAGNTVSTKTGNVVVDPGGSGEILLNSNVTVSGNISLSGSIKDIQGNDIIVSGGSADTGDITFDGTTISTADDEQRIQIQTRDEEGEWNTRITMDPDDVYIRMEARRGDDREFGTFDWTTATWLNDGGGNRIIFTDAASLIEFLDSALWSNGGNKQLSINDGERFDFNGTSINRNEEIVTLPIGSGGPTEPNTVSNIRFFWINESQIQLDQYDDERLRIDGNGIDMRVNITDGIEVRSGDDIDLRADDDFDIRADDRVRITGDRVRIRSNSSEDTVEIVTDNNDTQQTWEFKPDGSLKLPGNGNYTISNSEPGLVLSSNFGVALVTDAAEAGKAFIFGTGGDLTLPGAVVHEAVSATYDDEPVALDITKSVHKLANGEYSLADGQEGQIIYIVPQTGATYEGVEVFIANARVMTNAHTSQVVSDNLFLPFSSSTTGSLTNVVTLIFTDGAWNLSGGEWD